MYIGSELRVYVHKLHSNKSLSALKSAIKNLMKSDCLYHTKLLYADYSW